MAEEDEELLWDDEDVEQEEDAEQDAGDHVQDEEPGATADQEPHAQEDQPDAAKPAENKQAAVEEDKSAAKSQEPASSSRAEEPKRRFPPARVKPADNAAQPALNKALGQSDSKQPKTGVQANQASAPLKQQDKSKPVQPQQGRQGQGTGRSGRNIRYFVLRSFNEENIQIALQKSGWATTRHNEQKLDEAYSMADEVRLIFSVNGTDHFLGYAVMKTKIGEYPHGQIMWSNGKPFGREFAIEWRTYNPLPFGKVNHLSNPLNDNRPVKMSRDGTELPQDVGDQLVNLMEQQARMDGAPPPPRALGMGRGRGRGGDMGPGGRQQDMMGRGVGAGGMHGGGGHMGGMMGIGPMGMGGKPNQMMMMDAMMANGMGMHQGNGISMHHGNGMRGGMVGGGMAMGTMGAGGMGMGPGGMGRGPANQQGMGGMHGNQPQRERSRSPITRREGGVWGSRDNGPGGMLRRDTPPHMHGSSGMPPMVRDRERTRDQLEGVPGGPNSTASGMARLQNMTYEEYLEQYRKVQQHMEGIKEAQQQQQQHQVGRMGGQMPGGLMMGGMQGVNVGMGQGMGASMADQMQMQQQKAQLEQQQKLQQQQQQQMQLQQQMQQQQQMMATMQAMGMGIPPGMAAGGAMGMGMGGMPGMGMMGMMGGMNPMLAGAGGGMMMPGGMAGNQGFPMGPNMMMGTGAGGSVMASGGLVQNKPFSEDEYIAYTQAHFQSQGKQPPDTEYIRQHYRQQKQSLDMSGGQM